MTTPDMHDWLEDRWSDDYTEDDVMALIQAASMMPEYVVADWVAERLAEIHDTDFIPTRRFIEEEFFEDDEEE